MSIEARLAKLEAKLASTEPPEAAVSFTDPRAPHARGAIVVKVTAPDPCDTSPLRAPTPIQRVRWD